MPFGPDIERISPYHSLNPRVNAADSQQERKGKRDRKQSPEEPEDVLDRHEETDLGPTGPEAVTAYGVEDDHLDLSA
jgi:hypothetical protein